MTNSGEFSALIRPDDVDAQEKKQSSIRRVPADEWKQDIYRGWIEYVDLSYADIGMVRLVGVMKEGEALIGQAPDGRNYLIPYHGDQSFNRTSPKNMQHDVLVFEPDQRPAGFTEVVLEREN